MRAARLQAHKGRRALVSRYITAWSLGSLAHPRPAVCMRDATVEEASAGYSSAAGAAGGPLVERAGEGRVVCVGGGRPCLGAISVCRVSECCLGDGFSV